MLPLKDQGLVRLEYFRSHNAQLLQLRFNANRSICQSITNKFPQHPTGTVPERLASLTEVGFI